MKSIWFGLFIGLLLVIVSVKATAAQTKPAGTAPKLPAKITPAAIAQKVTAAPVTVKLTTAAPTTVKVTTAAQTTPKPAEVTQASTAKPPTTSVKPAATTAKAG